MQVTAAIMSGTQKQYELAHAILLYKEQAGQSVFASVHDINSNNKGLRTIAAGIPVSKIGLVEMMQSLLPEDYAPAELIEENILAKGNDHLVWWCKPQKRTVFFRCKDIAESEVNAPANLPALVFMVTKTSWYVFAIKDDQRPSANTPLYVAPFLNVWKGGKICTGNVEMPKGSMRFKPASYEAAFFDSYSTHSNQWGKGALTKYRGGIFALWRALMKGRKFPVNSLVDAGETLGQAFERTVKNGRS